jgi:hypothetical protein
MERTMRVDPDPEEVRPDPEEAELELLEVEDEVSQDQATIEHLRRTGEDTAEKRKELHNKVKALEQLRRHHFNCKTRSQ